MWYCGLSLNLAFKWMKTASVFSPTAIFQLVRQFWQPPFQLFMQSITCDVLIAWSCSGDRQPRTLFWKGWGLGGWGWGGQIVKEGQCTYPTVCNLINHRALGGWGGSLTRVTVQKESTHPRDSWFVPPQAGGEAAGWTGCSGGETCSAFQFPSNSATESNSETWGKANPNLLHLSVTPCKICAKQNRPRPSASSSTG